MALSDKAERNTTMKCCGNDVKTPFCPMCGNSQNSPGATLLAHIYEHVRESKRKLDAVRRSRQESTANLRRRERVIEKWEGWACFVGEAIRTSGGAER